MLHVTSKRLCCAFLSFALLAAVAGCNNSDGPVSNETPGVPPDAAKEWTYLCNRVDLSKTIIPSVLMLAGTKNGVIPGYEFAVGIRDRMNRPLNNIPVTIEWFEAGNFHEDPEIPGDISAVCIPQNFAGTYTRTYHQYGIVHSFAKHTWIDGYARFQIEGQSNGADPECLPSPYKTGAISICGMYITGESEGLFHVAIPNLDGNCGGLPCLGQGDVNVFVADFACAGSGIYKGRSDFDGDGSVDAVDLAILNGLINNQAANFTHVCGEN